MTRIKLTDEDIVINNYVPIDEEGDELTTIHINFNGNKEGAEQLKQQILEDYEFREKHERRFDGIKTIKELQEQVKELKDKADKWDKLIESQTFDFEPIDDVEEITRQLINNEIRTTHKLYEENKELKDKAEKYDSIIEYVGNHKGLFSHNVKEWIEQNG